jgi:DNA-binding GntR family transcriptional regulator
VIPLREALQVLIGEGLVKASTNRGVRAGRAIERDIARRLRLLVSKLEIPAYLYDPA